jgi:mono/diheme cytochrome c family protein
MRSMVKTFCTRLLLLFAVPLIAVIVAIFWLCATGLSARDTPGALETRLAIRVQRLAIPRAARELSNPMQATPAMLVEARRHFADHCASCHGNDGRGTAEMGRKLYPPAPDMTLPATQDLTDGELYYIIENGVRFTGMPAWGKGGTNDEDTWQLVLLIRHLPRMTREDLLDMGDYNPRSPAEIQEEEKEEQFLNQQSK